MILLNLTPETIIGEVGISGTGFVFHKKHFCLVRVDDVPLITRSKEELMRTATGLVRVTRIRN